jgi:hypothetical protein
VVNPGWAQIADTLLVAIATCGITCSIFGRFVDSWRVNTMWRTVLALASLVVMFHPDDGVATAAAVFVLPATVYGVWLHRRVAPPKTAFAPQPVT